MMNPDDIMKMMEYMAGGVETAEDIKFVDKHLEGFNTFLLDMTTNRLVKAGIDQEEVEAMLHGLVQTSRMLGASQFQEFVQFHQIVEDF
jgi:hypothetical protein